MSSVQKPESVSQWLKYYALFILKLILLGLVVFVVVGLPVSYFKSDLTELFLSYDLKVSEHFVALRSDKLTPFVKVITDLGSAMAYTIILPVLALVTYLLKSRWQLILSTSIVLVLAHILNILLKHFASRPRPDISLRLIEAGSYSFPSGHSMSAMVLYGMLIYVSNKLIQNAVIRYSMTFFLSLLIIGIGLSRVYLGVHYISDVIAGFLIGLIWVRFSVWGLSK